MNNTPLQTNGIHSLLSTVLSGGHNALSLLLFHKVPTQADVLVPDELCLANFEKILDFLAESTRVLPLTDAVAALRRGKLPKKAVAITFDDGYKEWVTGVAPALLKRSLPATFFVTTEVLTGTVLWHERIVSAVRALPPVGAKLPYGFAGYADLTSTSVRASLVRELQDRLKYQPLQERLETICMLEAQAARPLEHTDAFGVEDVRQLHSLGFEIGAHTVQHPILNECTDAEAMAEIAGSKATLESLIKGSVKHFAYPNGRPGLDFQAKHVAMVKAAGYQGAVSSTGGVAGQSSDIFQLPRTTIWGHNHLRMAYHLARNKFSPLQLVKPQPPVVRCLLIASTFAPIHGGSAVVYENLCKHMPPGTIRVLAASENYLTHKPIPGCADHDVSAHYPVDRVPLLRPKMLPPPANALVSVYRLVFQDLPLYASNLWAAARLVHKHRINVVCVGELVTGSWLGFALRRIFGAKVVIYVHGEEVTTATGGRLHGNRRGAYLRSADKVVAVSGFTCDALTHEMDVAPKALALIQNGVDTVRFTPGPASRGSGPRGRRSRRRFPW